MIQFPANFRFGAASSSYQIEGAWNEDGKGESIWDRFAHTPGKIKTGDTGDVACDFYHRYPEDVALMKEIGLQAYRMSVSWPRILPAGRGTVNPKGLDFYNRVVDDLLAAGITPCINLFHWELPQVLQDQGGWTNRDCAGWFADFADVMVKNLGDRVTDWMTLNEPFVFTMLGHFLGWHAPGQKNIRNIFKVNHHLLLGHGMAAQTIKAARPAARVGIALDLRPIHPLSEGEQDRRAVRNADVLMRRAFLDPIFHGDYPAKYPGRNWLMRPRILDGDMQTIATPLDYVGINTYTRDRVRYTRIPFSGGFRGLEELPTEDDFVKDGVQYTAMGWEVYPMAVYEVLMLLKNEYGNPVTYVTENGAAFTDTVEDGRVHDDKRVAYLQAHLGGVKQAIDEGANCQGYFVWTLTDNFEWAEGYSKRFGIVYVDHQTQERIIKDSGLWYRDVIATQGESAS